jgi:hypothetical protein
MRCIPAKITAALLLAAARPAAADAAPVESRAEAESHAGGGPRAAGDGFLDRFVLDAGRIPFKAPDRTRLQILVHGEYQLRFQGQSTLPLEPPAGQPPIDRLGQNLYLYHWLRVGARVDVSDKLSLVMQIDAPRGMIAGQTTQWVDAARDSLAQAKWYEIHPRYLYVEVPSPLGVFRLGQQGAHWGMGILAHDGDHATLFGDHRRGSLVERVIYVATPMGEDTPLFFALGGDVVFQDATADLIAGDRAVQGVAALGWRAAPAEIGVYGVARHQERSAQAVDQYTAFVDHLTVGEVDVAGRFHLRVPGVSAFVYGEAEAAAVFGSTSFVRGAFGNAIDPTAPRPDEAIRTYGGAATLGVVAVSSPSAVPEAMGPGGEDDDRYGTVLGEIEVGYASGDANPGDGVTRRFTFDENHHVGLVLFDQVLRWKTARAAAIAQDPALFARAVPGNQLLPSNGGVFGAQYINPRFVVRPWRFLDLKGGVVIAQTTADFVDPYRFAALGNTRNYDGGDPRAHDLGVEIDAGAAARIRLDPGATLQVGAEGGVLFPGRAFDDAAGNKLPNQYLGTLQLGLQF